MQIKILDRTRKDVLLFFALFLSYDMRGIGKRVCYGLSLDLNTLMLFSGVSESFTLSGFLFILQKYLSSDPFLSEVTSETYESQIYLPEEGRTALGYLNVLRIQTATRYWTSCD